MYTKKISNLDFLLIVLVFGITIFGIVAISSATHVNLPGGDPSVYLSQVKWFILGIFLMILAIAIDYEYAGKFYWVAYLGIIVLLVMVLIFGKSTKGATRWIQLFGFTIQPSEFAKVVFIFCLSRVISLYEERLNHPLTVLAIFIFTAIPCFLVYKQPSLSVSLVILAILATELFVGGLSYKYVFAFLAVLLPSMAMLLIDIFRQTPLFATKILERYHIERIRAVVYPEEYPDIAYQSVKSVTAMGSGQLEGKGLYQGTLNQISDLPEQHNDFIFTIIGEEFGFIGCAIVLAILLLIIIRCVMISYRASDLFGRLIAAGTAGMFTFQTFVHCGVTMAILPTTGMGLPFLSYGGSSLWTNLIAIGLVLNVGMKRPKSFFEGG